jgi:hypothetical protein
MDEEAGLTEVKPASCFFGRVVAFLNGRSLISKV